MTHPLTITFATLLFVGISTISVAYLIRFFAYLILGIHVTKHAFALSGKLVMWSMMILGIFTLLACFAEGDEEEVFFGIARFFGETLNSGNSLALEVCGYGCSFTGFALFIYKIWRWIYGKARLLLETLGDRILEVQA